AAQDIVAAAAAQDIGSPQSVHRVVSAEAVDRRSVAAAGQHVGAGRAGDLVAPRIPDRVAHVQVPQRGPRATDIDDPPVGQLHAIVNVIVRTNDELIANGIAGLAEPLTDSLQQFVEPGDHEAAVGKGRDRWLLLPARTSGYRNVALPQDTGIAVDRHADVALLVRVLVGPRNDESATGQGGDIRQVLGGVVGTIVAAAATAAVRRTHHAGGADQ